MSNDYNRPFSVITALGLLVQVCCFCADGAESKEQLLSRLSKNEPRFIFVKRRPVQPSFYAYTEGQSDAQGERHFLPESKLCVLEITPDGCRVRDLLTDARGVIRDPDVSFDGKSVLFSWKKDLKKDDYHLYELNLKTRKIKQLTSGKGVADYEGIYLPDGGIMFSSTRCVQIVDCWWTEVSNMYRYNRKDGKIRRLGFDQVHTSHPALLNNGTVVYTRWDYNDRGQVFPQPLFQMNPDGTGQTEYYGNNSWFPTTINHACSIPGSEKIVAVLHGHHTWQAGKLAIIDRTKGTQEATGVQLIAPVRKTVAKAVDRYGQDGDLFRHPYALGEEEFIVSLRPHRSRHFDLYWVHANGERQLLHRDGNLSCNSPVPLRSRKKPAFKASVINDARKTGIYFMQDIHVGPGLKGIKRGTVKELRVVALEYRAAGIGHNNNKGEAGGALVSTPVSIGNGAWDVKRILGSAKVYKDGSAMFEVPANTPVYFQAIDDRGQVVQTMRSWSTLMPGEFFGCVGCHEDKTKTPPPDGKTTLAAKAGTEKLKQFYGPARGFSFIKEIQPILDKHCVKCHDGPTTITKGKTKKPKLNLTGKPLHDRRAMRRWTLSYVELTGANVKLGRHGYHGLTGKDSRDVLNWISSQSRPSMLPPYYRGSAKSGMIQKLRKGHGKTRLTREEMDKLCAWIDLGVPFCGDYLEANVWNKKSLGKYKRFLVKRKRFAASGK